MNKKGETKEMLISDGGSVLSFWKTSGMPKGTFSIVIDDDSGYTSLLVDFKDW